MEYGNTRWLNPQGEIERMSDNSFKLVLSKMPQKDQQSILLHL
jgi:hypothetical protein